jgi:hypothetical protein
MRTLAGLCLAVLLVTGAEAALLCRKPSGVVVMRDTVCKKKEAAVDLAALGARDTLGSLSCGSGQGVQWTGTAWACATAGSVPGDLTVGGNADLLGNGAADGRIEGFALGDPQPQTNASYDNANAARLPFYLSTVVGAGDLTAPCRTGDLLVSGGCVATNDCYLARSYPIVNPTSGQSGWHCRALSRVDGSFCLTPLTTLSVCLKSF